ncbi:MAG: hypothetical protein ACUVT9_02780 [Candidatus Bathycorpusculaceae bacterium]
MPQKEFQKTLLTAIDEGLSSLGESPKQAIIFHLENSFKLRKEEIPANLTEFSKALEKIFGEGAKYLEKLIVKRLYEKFGLPIENANSSDFLNSVEKLKRSLTSKRSA